ncbi:condensin complex protein MksE [Sanguibacteroides sp. AM78-02pH3A]|uniref:condensin complex protein MksE n=1 Tax=Sanguibacteroides sp. AM78-02pH3A TaxID=3002646 RepID=UPI0022E2BD93|nr:hypothetical protein [Sanguibacteroides sp. AM78-02pH3A]
MGYLDETEIKNPYDFLDCKQGKELFALLDFALKDGVHIQEYGKQKELCSYLRRFYPTLAQYYREFWGLELEQGGNDSETYFYLKFCPDLKNGIPTNHKHLMSKENIIVGLLLYKVYYNDCNIELNSLSKFQRIIKLDYPDLKPGIIKTLAKAKKEKATQFNDEKIDACIKNAFDEFSKIKWIEMDGDSFEILPSFRRLTREFAPYINNIDEILKESQDEKLPANS